MPSLLEHAVIELSDGRYCQGWPSRSWTTLLRRGRPCSIAAEGDLGGRERAGLSRGRAIVPLTGTSSSNWCSVPST